MDRGLIGGKLARVVAVSTALLVPLALSACGGGKPAAATVEVDPNGPPNAGRLAAALRRPGEGRHPRLRVAPRRRC